MNRIILALLIIIVIVVVGIGAYGYSVFSGSSQNGTLVIYAADSLATPINQTNTQFNDKYPKVTIQPTYQGSSALVSQITTLNKTPDIMISANAALINNKLIPNYSSYNIQYAANELVVAYTNKSKNASQINSNNWYQILSTPGVKYAVSDPNSDPAGQYSVMMLQLANSYYNNSTIFSSLISDNSAITSVANNTTNGTNYVINAPTNENPHGDLTIGADAAALTPLVQTDSIDYLITYKSLAQSANLSYVTLPSELSLTNASFQSDYNTIQLKQFSDANNSSVVKMAPIIYGITILNNAPDKQIAEEYVQLMLSSTGINITQSNYLIPITPAILTNVSTNLPSSLQSYVVNASATNLP